MLVYGESWLNEMVKHNVEMFEKPMVVHIYIFNEDIITFFKYIL